MNKVGIFLTAYGEQPEDTAKAIRSLLATIDHPTDFIVHATNAGPATKQVLADLEVRVLAERHELSLAAALNECLRHYLQDPEVMWAGWIHTDMEFPQPWIGALVGRLRADPTIGKISPNCQLTHDVPERQGNDCPWLMRTDMLRKIGLFDEGFLGGGTKEDWFMNRQIMAAGYRCVISPVSEVIHIGMVTRTKFQTTRDEIAIRNSQYYFDKCGTHDPPV